MNIPLVPSYLALKAIHIIFMVSYFAGIFYLIRIFIYYIDAEEKDEIERRILQKQYIFMISRLWNIITVPAGVIMLVTGFFMMIANDYIVLKSQWFWIKLVFLAGLAAYHWWSWRCIQKIKRWEFNATSLHLRMMNEVATLILFAVVFVVIFKFSFMDMWLSLLIAFVVLVAFIMLIVKFVNRIKNKK
ncbi:MAG: CopD family protein [Flavobacteriaceae bacterium]|jgi:putative membrane protein|nr:CopD family protein [Flavobacteriaceae bacterium]